MWVYKTITDISKDVKVNDKLLKNSKRESQNSGKNSYGSRGSGITEAQYCDLPYFRTKVSLIFTLRLEKGKIRFYFGFS